MGEGGIRVGGGDEVHVGLGVAELEIVGVAEGTRVRVIVRISVGEFNTGIVAEGDGVFSFVMSVKIVTFDGVPLLLTFSSLLFRSETIEL